MPPLVYPRSWLESERILLPILQGTLHHYQLSLNSPSYFAYRNSYNMTLGSEGRQIRGIYRIKNFLGIHAVSSLWPCNRRRSLPHLPTRSQFYTTGDATVRLVMRG